MKPYYSLSRAKLIGKQKTKKLKNLPVNNEKAFYKEWVEEIDKSFQSLFQQSALNNQPLATMSRIIFSLSASLARTYSQKLTSS